MDKERLKDEDLLTEVLSRLPVKSLLRCKAVSKTWLSLISTPFFVKSHLHRAITRHDFDETLIGNFYTEFKQGVEGSFSLFQFSSLENLTNLKFPYSKGDYPVYPRNGPIYHNLSSNGPKYHNFEFILPLQSLVLFAELFVLLKLIPPHTIQHYDRYTHIRYGLTLGFGFDPIDFDFKVVRVVGLVPPCCECEVYSANTNTWTKIELPNLTDTPHKCYFELCLRGFLFIRGYDGMMAFDLNKEVFICDINIPIICYKLCQTSKDYRIFSGSRIIDFKDSIAFATCSDEFKLWTLDDEACFRTSGGVKASWTIALSLYVEPLEYFIGFFNSGEFLLESEDGQWLSYNFDKKVGKYVNVNPFFKSGQVCKYTESLHSVAGSKLVSDSEDDLENDNEKSNVCLEEGL